MPKTKKKLNQIQENGGSEYPKSDVFQMVDAAKERPSINEEIKTEVDRTPEGVESSSITDEATQEVNKILIETAAKLIGKTTELVTRMPEMNFDETEVEQLKEVWGSVLPPMSPIVVAVTTTLMIVAGKITIYMTLKKQKEGS